MKRRALIGLAIALGLAYAVFAQAALYKWVDEKGVTQYSETPPLDGKAKKIEIAPAPPPVQAPKEDWKQHELEYKQRHLKDEQQKEQDARLAAQRRERCLKARHEIDTLGKGIPVYHVNEQGQRVYLDDTERARQVAGWKQRAQETCD